MNKTFFTLSFLMGVVVLASNYLVHFPIKYYGLEEILLKDGVKNFNEIVGKKD